MFYLSMILTYFALLPPHLGNKNVYTDYQNPSQMLAEGVEFGAIQGGSTYQLLKVSRALKIFQGFQGQTKDLKPVLKTSCWLLGRT